MAVPVSYPGIDSTHKGVAYYWNNALYKKLNIGGPDLTMGGMNAPWFDKDRAVCNKQKNAVGAGGANPYLNFNKVASDGQTEKVCRSDPEDDGNAMLPAKLGCDGMGKPSGWQPTGFWENNFDDSKWGVPVQSYHYDGRFNTLYNWQPFDRPFPWADKDNIGASVWYGGWSELARAGWRTQWTPAFNDNRPTRDDGTELDLLGGRRDSFCDIICESAGGWSWSMAKMDFWRQNTLPDDPHKYIPVEAFKVHVVARLLLC
jgi:hypothetical protein